MAATVVEEVAVCKRCRFEQWLANGKCRKCGKGPTVRHIAAVVRVPGNPGGCWIPVVPCTDELRAKYLARWIAGWDKEAWRPKSHKKRRRRRRKRLQPRNRVETANLLADRWGAKVERRKP